MDAAIINQYEVPIRNGLDNFTKLITIIGKDHLPKHTLPNHLAIKQDVLRKFSGIYKVHTVNTMIQRMNTKNTVLLVELNPSDLTQRFTSINLYESMQIPIKKMDVDYRENFGSPFQLPHLPYPISKQYLQSLSLHIFLVDFEQYGHHLPTTILPNEHSK